VTIKDVAVEAGVSDMSVSNAFSGKGRLAEQTRVRILDTARRLGYRPNAASRAIRRGRFNAIGVLDSANVSASGIGIGILHGVETEARKHDMHLVSGRLPDEKLTSPDSMPRLLREWAADGLLIGYATNIPPRMIELVDRYSMPAVWVNALLQRDCVRPDDFGGARQATEHLLQQGYRRIAYYGEISGPHYSTPHRYDGYIAAMEQAGLDTRTIEKPGRTQAYQQIIEQLRDAQRPDAILMVGNPIEWMMAALQLGLSVPQDLGLMVIRDPATVAIGAQHDYLAGMRITGMELPVFEVGRQAVRMLTRKIAQPAEPLEPVVVPMTFAPGQTCDRAN
jgi:LacI family transcriptional regulator/LacI family repressor for deo operon, udp, cdd, tsx, nupC, and nupG